ncbi:MAG: hypothetical protein JRI22_15940 [Deltaproteobacteria bacterium]|nr:hypothetical protein [Deltaproteobacteria bacterium]
MYKGHPWEGETYGAMEYEYYLKRTYELIIGFDVNMKPFIDLCKEGDHSSNQLTMKIAARLSTKYLPQYMIALNGRTYPVRYPAGYVRPVRPGADMLDHIAVAEDDDRFREVNIRDQINPYQQWMMKKHPKISVWFAQHFFGARETKKNYALLISRNPLRKLDTPVIILGSHVRTMGMAIPFGEKVCCTFFTPHAFGNTSFFEPFLFDFKTCMEEPEKIPKDLLNKQYREVPTSE